MREKKQDRKMVKIIQHFKKKNSVKPLGDKSPNAVSEIVAQVTKSEHKKALSQFLPAHVCVTRKKKWCLCIPEYYAAMKKDGDVP